jgi:hypothetical protein
VSRREFPNNKNERDAICAQSEVAFRHAACRPARFDWISCTSWRIPAPQTLLSDIGSGANCINEYSHSQEFWLFDLVALEL